MLPGEMVIEGDYEPGCFVAMAQGTLDNLRAWVKVRNPGVRWEDIPWDMVGTPIVIDGSLPLGHVAFRNGEEAEGNGG